MKRILEVLGQKHLNKSNKTLTRRNPMNSGRQNISISNPCFRISSVNNHYICKSSKF